MTLTRRMLPPIDSLTLDGLRDELCGKKKHKVQVSRVSEPFDAIRFFGLAVMSLIAASAAAGASAFIIGIHGVTVEKLLIGGIVSFVIGLIVLVLNDSLLPEDVAVTRERIRAQKKALVEGHFDHKAKR